MSFIIREAVDVHLYVWILDSVLDAKPSGFVIYRSLEGILRSLNNLLERLHHSEFFYVMSSPMTFLSIGQYSPFFGLLVAPLILEVREEEEEERLS